MEDDHYPPPILPAEVIHNIIGHLIPENPPVAFAPDHLVTKTLLALSRTCKATSSLATTLLLQHCLYIKGKDRLLLVVRGLCTENGRSALGSSTFQTNGTSLYFAPWPATKDDFPCLPLWAEGVVKGVDLADYVEVLFEKLGPYIRRLVIDRPQRSYGETIKGEVILRKSLMRMPRLQEFSSFGDHGYLLPGFRQIEVWNRWPQLRRLALNGISLDPSIIAALKRNQTLQHLILESPAGLPGFLRRECFRHMSQKLKLLTVVNMHNPDILEDWGQREDSFLIDESIRLQLKGNEAIRALQEASILWTGVVIRLIDLPDAVDQPQMASEDEPVLPGDLILRHALAGTLWGLGGRSYISNGCQCVST